jgi:ubiquinone/menaquinone biosynthesis C-methylase UbiE
MQIAQAAKGKLKRQNEKLSQEDFPVFRLLREPSANHGTTLDADETGRRSTQAHFDKAAESYDRMFTRTLIGQAERQAVWRELRRVFESGQRILELNCGTGVDAVYLAGHGVQALACDISPRMIEVARQRLSSNGLQHLADFRVLATEDIALLSDEGPFDGAFSNFGGLNCVADLSAVARDLAQLLKPGAPALICLGGRFVPVEIAWHLAHGNVGNALRRFRPARSNDHIWVHYPSVDAMARLFAPQFSLRRWRGIGVTLPPTYLERWAHRRPKMLEYLARADYWCGKVPLLRRMAGHVLLQFERL